MSEINPDGQEYLSPAEIATSPEENADILECTLVGNVLSDGTLERKAELGRDQLACLLILMASTVPAGSRVFKDGGFPRGATTAATRTALNKAILELGGALEYIVGLPPGAAFLTYDYGKNKKYRLNPLIRVLKPDGGDAVGTDSDDRDQLIISNAGLRTLAEVALFLSSGVPKRPVSQEQVLEVASKIDAIRTHEGKFSSFAVKLIAEELGIAYPAD